MTKLLALLATVAAVLAATASASTDATFPKRIDLPDGFQPEGIATAGERFFTGSLANGAVYRGSLRTGKGALLVQPQAGRIAVGMKEDRGRLFVAGGRNGNAFVYDARTGRNLAAYQFVTSGDSFVNDVVVTKNAAWFTDSFKPVLYRVPLGPGGRPGAPTSFRTVQLGGDYQQASGFNVNGIDATANGKTLLIVQSGMQALHRHARWSREDDCARARRERAERRRDPPRRENALRRSEHAQCRRQDRALGEPPLGAGRPAFG